MDDSKLRLRRSAGQHASSLLCVEEGNGTDRGSNSSSLGIGCLGANSTKSPTNSNSHLNLNSLGSSTTTSSTTTGGGALSSLLSYNNGKKIGRRIKQRRNSISLSLIHI